MGACEEDAVVIISDALHALALGESSATPCPCPRPPRWMWWLAAAALAVTCAWSNGCSSRLPPYAESALRVTVAEARRDIDGRGPVRDGYRKTLAVLCSLIERSNVEGRGWIEYVAGLAGVTEHEDAGVVEGCE